MSDDARREFDRGVSAGCRWIGLAPVRPVEAARRLWRLRVETAPPPGTLLWEDDWLGGDVETVADRLFRLLGPHPAARTPAKFWRAARRNPPSMAFLLGFARAVEVFGRLSARKSRLPIEDVSHDD